MDHLRLQSAFKFVAISRFGDGGQLMPRSSRLKVHSKNSLLLSENAAHKLHRLSSNV